MISLAISLAVGAVLLAVGTSATVYLMWFQRKLGMSIFSVLATSDALATLIMAVGYFINASNQMTERQVPGECSHGQLFLATALFIGPFLNAFLAILCQSTTCSAALQEQKLPNIVNKRFIGSISAKLLVPLLSVLLLFTASVNQYPLEKQDVSGVCPSYSSVNIFPVITLQFCSVDKDTGNYIVDLMEHHSQELITNYKSAAFINNTGFISNATSFIVKRIYSILQELNTNKMTKSSQHQQPNMSNYGDISNFALNSHLHSSSDTHLRHLLSADYYNATEDASNNLSQKFLKENYPEYGPNSTRYAQTLLEDPDKIQNQSVYNPDSRHYNVAFLEVNTFSEDTSDLENEDEENTEHFEDLEQMFDNITQAVTLAVNDPSSVEDAQENPESNLPLHNNDTFIIQSNNEQYTEEIQHTNTEHSTVINQEESNMTFPISFLNSSYIDSNQLTDTFGLCVFECYFSPTFLKTYLFILLFIGYFLPIVGSTTMHATTMKGLTMQLKATQQEKSSTEDINNMCAMQLMKLSQASNTNKHSIISSILLWTPSLIETLGRVWFCVNSPTWFSTLLFLLGQSYTLVQNILNIKLVKCYSCITPVQPLSESSTSSADMPTTLFTKVEKAAAEE